MPMSDNRGFTLIEIILGALTLAIAAAALLGAFLGQITLNEHARNLSLAIHDANRVLEQIREENVACATKVPVIEPPGAATSWDAWLNAQGKSVPSINVTAEERIFVTCESRTQLQYCGLNQMGSGEWHAGVSPVSSNLDPVRVTVAVCWRHRQRTLGECTWNGTTLNANAGGSDPSVLESPAMLTTLVTCRG